MSQKVSLSVNGRNHDVDVDADMPLLQRISEMPTVESIIMPSSGSWNGVGEPTIGVAAPAVLKTIFAATGKRIRSFPLTRHNLRMV
jgi:CO/xanthine dehydrogenase Mo-binding subunit